MTATRVLVTHGYLRQLVPLQGELYPIDVLTEHGDSEDDYDRWLMEHGAGIRAVVTSGMERVDAARLAWLPDLELIAVAAAGLDAIDLETAAARGRSSRQRRSWLKASGARLALSYNPRSPRVSSLAICLKRLRGTTFGNPAEQNLMKETQTSTAKVK